ncbi:MAG: autotransporter outer membrane beta-barrel domain-containing protein, partial [Sutterellaceae bacterium]|nr:autotransporter outer membrane beta-barrel domain-containing protein [Sutterellaceae bacterium]
IQSDTGRAFGISSEDGTLTVTGAAKYSVIATQESARGIRIAGGKAEFQDLVDVTARGLETSYGLHVTNGAEVSFAKSATFTTQAAGEGDKNSYGVSVTGFADNPDRDQTKVTFNGGLTVNTTGQGNALLQAAVLASTNGIVTVNGGALVTTEIDYLALKAMSGGTITISGEDDPTTQIVGNVWSTGAGSSISLDLVGAESSLTGAVSQEENGAVAMNLNDGAKWNVSAKANSVGTLGLDSGTLVIDQAGTSIGIDNLTLAGANTFVVQEAPSSNGKYLIAQNVTGEGTVLVDGSGAYNDGRTTVEAAVEALDAAFVDKDDNSIVDSVHLAEGNIFGEVFATKDSEGHYSITEKTNSKLDALNSIHVLSALAWRHEMNSLNKRMGELRDAPAGIGSWVRIYGSEMEYGDQNVTSKNTTIQLGSDVSVGDWKLGVAAHYTDGESTYDYGSADTKNYGVALYASWLAQCGGYVDLIAKYTRLDNDFALKDMGGSYDNNAFSFSAETGYKLDVIEGMLFVEPQIEVSYGHVSGDTFTTSNGVRIEQDGYYSLLGRIGVRTGFTFPNKKGTIYAKVSGVHDFGGEMESVARFDRNSNKIKDDIGGTYVEYGVGANFNWTENTYTYIDLERTSGGEVKENYRWNIGLRHTF